jgi:hypothetical protein
MRDMLSTTFWVNVPPTGAVVFQVVVQAGVADDAGANSATSNPAGRTTSASNTLRANLRRVEPLALIVCTT